MIIKSLIERKLLHLNELVRDQDDIIKIRELLAASKAGEEILIRDVNMLFEKHADLFLTLA